MTLQEAIVSLGYTGQTNDAWHEMWDDENIPPGTWNNRMYAWLGSLDYTGALPDRIQKYLASL